MLNELSGNDLFCNYYKEWISVYKENAVRQVTLNKYHLALAWIERLAPDMKLAELDCFWQELFFGSGRVIFSGLAA